MRVQGLHQESKPFQDSHKQRHKSSVGPIGVARSSLVTRAISSLKLRMGLKPRACCATNFEELSHPSRCHCWAPLRKLFWLNPYSRRCSSVAQGSIYAMFMCFWGAYPGARRLWGLMDRAITLYQVFSIHFRLRNLGFKTWGRGFVDVRASLEEI